MTTKSTKAIIDQLSRHPNYGCYSRQGTEILIWPKVQKRARYLIFADVDFMHDLNKTFGKAEINRRIKKSMKVRAGDISAVIPASYSSGDELFWLLLDGPRMGDPLQTVKRLARTFEKNGVKATWSIVKVKSKSLSKNIERADALVAEAKRRHRRGSISEE